MIAEIIGYVAGFFIMVSFIPQLIKSHRTKSVEDISISMIIATIIGTLFWIIYGFMINKMPIIVVNIIFLATVLYQLFLKIRYD
jgi:MtN3 and saliva related transmembrane protein